MKWTHAIVVEAGGGANLEQITQDAEWLRNVLREKGINHPIIMVKHNETYYRSRWEAVDRES